MRYIIVGTRVAEGTPAYYHPMGWRADRRDACRYSTKGGAMDTAKSLCKHIGLVHDLGVVRA